MAKVSTIFFATLVLNAGPSAGERPGLSTDIGHRRTLARRNSIGDAHRQHQSQPADQQYFDHWIAPMSYSPSSRPNDAG
jgi:hypothetical protein